jgi:hypothetical protein
MDKPEHKSLQRADEKFSIGDQPVAAVNWFGAGIYAR